MSDRIEEVEARLAKIKRAKKLWPDHTAQEIGEEIGVLRGTVAKWAARYGWGAKVVTAKALRDEEDRFWEQARRNACQYEYPSPHFPHLGSLPCGEPAYRSINGNGYCREHLLQGADLEASR